MDKEQFNSEEFTEVPTVERFLAGEPVLHKDGGRLQRFNHFAPDKYMTDGGIAFRISWIKDGSSTFLSEYRMRPAKAEPIATLAPEPTKQEAPEPNKQASALPNWMRDFQ